MRLIQIMIISIILPVCVRMWACSDFSRGNTREQILHLMLLAERAPSRISDDIFSALGLPRLLWSTLNTPEGSPSRESASCELVDDDRGLNAARDGPSAQLHGYIVVKYMCSPWKVISQIDRQRDNIYIRCFTSSLYMYTVYKYIGNLQTSARSKNRNYAFIKTITGGQLLAYWFRRRIKQNCLLRRWDFNL